MSGNSVELSKSKRPSVIALLFGIWALVAPIGYSHGMLNADGDLGRHIVLGNHVLRHGVAFPDVFSNTKAGEEFIAYEWLSEVILALVHSWGGLAAVAILAGLLIASSVAIVALFLRGRLEAGGILLVGTYAVVLTYPHWIARPHLFSFVTLAVLLLFTCLPGNWKRHLGLAVLFSLWANLHPGFPYGLAVLFAFLVGDALDHPTRQRALVNGLSGMAAFLGTFVNPLGWGLHWNIAHHLMDTGAMGLVEEFQPVAWASPYGILFFLGLAGFVWILSVRGKRPPLSAFLPFIASLFAALLAVRNVPLFALFALPLMVEAISRDISAWRWRAIEDARQVMEADDRRARTVPYLVGTLGLLLVLAGTSGRVGPLQVVEDGFSNEDMPVEAVRRAREAGLSHHTLFNEYRWGGYILYAWPEQTIFIDGMANFFGSSLMEEYLSIWLTQEGWKEKLGNRGIDLMILPPEVALAREARKLPEWEVFFEDPTAVVLRRGGPREPGQ
jgi:hypothetical protein